MREGGYLDQFAEPGIILSDPATPFVADFVGSDRAIKRLALTSIDVAALAAPRDEPGMPQIDVSTRLREALVALLESPDGHVLVTRDGSVLGTLSMADVHRAMVAEDPAA
jgi:osmoprotectant transport system ATP-binding protein